MFELLSDTPIANLEDRINIVVNHTWLTMAGHQTCAYKELALEW